MDSNKEAGTQNATTLAHHSEPPKDQSQKKTKSPKPPKGPTPPKAKLHKELPLTADPDSMFKVGFLADLYKENSVGSEGIQKVVTRFPPEPNGFLHLGHSKAIAINFGFARFHGGNCNLRFDDTNPSREEEKFFVAIKDTISWLGFKPANITYSSDNFDSLYELAEELIGRDGAYVCHCSKIEILDQRGGGKGTHARYPCLHRNRPISESLAEFRAMRDGKYEPQEAMLRMKQDLDVGNPQMWDLTAYRVLQSKHPDDKNGIHYRTGDKWKIYPTYDFTHCLVDSIEGITHSLCTTEFELSRVSYNWLCDRVGMYRPMQREFGRLSLAGTVLSKRKILALISGGHVHDWDDPRLYTLVALRRRGVPPGAILSFINELGVTKATTTIEIKRFEQSVRRYLETTVPRLMLVLDPILVLIENLPDDYVENVELPFSKDPAYGIHTVPFTRKVYIDRSDFRETSSKDFFRLTPSTSVGLLKVPYPILATSFEKDPDSGLVTVVHATYEIPENGLVFRKPKTYIHWVADCPSRKSPIKARVRVFNPLFTSDNPDSHPDVFLSVVNQDSEEIFPNAMIETGYEEIAHRAPWRNLEGENDVAPGQAPPESVRFQGMRVGYFCLDRDSTEENVVLNRITSLKEDPKKIS